MHAFYAHFKGKMLNYILFGDSAFSYTDVFHTSVSPSFFYAKLLFKNMKNISEKYEKYRLIFILKLFVVNILIWYFSYHLNIFSYT